MTLNSLCGNKYWHNEITVTKYLCGITILKNMRTLMDRKLQREGLAPLIAGSVKKVKREDSVQDPPSLVLKSKPSFFRQLSQAISRKNEDITHGKSSSDLAKAKASSAKDRKSSKKRKASKKPSTKTLVKHIAKQDSLQEGPEHSNSQSARGLLPNSNSLGIGVS